MRRGTGSKQKGASFERRVCVKLSLWVSGGKANDLYWRSAMSGGRATRGQLRGEKLSRQAGDICAVAEEGHLLTDLFFIEVKFYRRLRFELFFLQGQGPLANFWGVAVEQAAKYGKRAMLIAKQNRIEEIVLIEANSLSARGIVLVPKLNCEVYLFGDLLNQRFKDVIYDL